MLTTNSTIVAAKDQVSCDLGGEAAILNVKSGVYYGLDPVGARIWSLLQEPCSVQSIRDTIQAEYDVTAERCEQDILELLSKLEREGLVQIHAAQTE